MYGHVSQDLAQEVKSPFHAFGNGLLFNPKVIHNYSFLPQYLIAGPKRSNAASIHNIYNQVAINVIYQSPKMTHDFMQRNIRSRYTFLTPDSSKTIKGGTT